MPRLGMRLAGIAVLLSLAVAAGGCSALEQVPQSTTPPAPAASAAPKSWVVDLAVSGDMGGTMNQVSPDTSTQRSVCTGRRGRGAATWVMNFYSFLGRDAYGVEVTVSGYRGPGTYKAPEAAMQVYRPDNTLVWRTTGKDPFALTIGNEQDSGRLQATLTNLTNNSSKLWIAGTWTCPT